MNEKPKGKLRWRLLRWGLIALAILATLAAALVTEENWRGKRAWENYQRDAKARGERLDIASVIPPAVPDDQNFFCAPIVAEALEQIRKDDSDHSGQSSYRMNLNIFRGDSENLPKHGGDWQKGSLTDLKEWQTYFRNFAQTPEGKTNGFPVAATPQSPAADVLLALSTFDPVVKELRAALQRPDARLPLNYEDGFDGVGQLIPYLANVKRCGQFFQLHALAELGDSQGGAALDDVKSLLGVNDSLRNQPFLISHLVRIAVMAITLQPVYEGLAQQRWNDSQLKELEETLARQDFLADFDTAMRGEKVCAIQAFEKQRLTREIKTFDDSHGTNRIITTSLRWMPSAYFYQNELAVVQMHAKYILPLVDQTNRIISPAGYRKTIPAVEAQLKHCFAPYQAQALMNASASSAGVTKTAKIQAQVDLARVACALERYRLANGAYPESLAALTPQFIAQLPHDLINGQPLHYHSTEDGRFVLYSIGWDEKDDGGKVVLTKKGSVDSKQGDWVWQYPEK